MFLETTKLVEDFVHDIFVFNSRVLQKILEMCLHPIEGVFSKVGCSKHEFILHLKLDLTVPYVQVTLEQEPVKVLSLFKILLRRLNFD